MCRVDVTFPFILAFQLFVFFLDGLVSGGRFSVGFARFRSVFVEHFVVEVKVV